MRVYGQVARFLEGLGASFGITSLRIGIGIIYLWFGVPKLFPEVSPAEELASDTVQKLTFGIIEGTTASVVTGLLEAVIGLLLISKKALSLTVMMLLGHMAGTLTPLVIFPERTWETFLIGTLEGQYILKNMVIVAAALVIVGHSNSRKRPQPVEVSHTNRLDQPASNAGMIETHVPAARSVRAHSAKKAHHDDHVTAPRR